LVGYCVYILSNDSYGVYVGQTRNLVARLNAHNRGLVVSSRSGCPWKLVCAVQLSSRKDSLVMESICKRLYSGKWGYSALANKVKSDMVILQGHYRWVWVN